MLKKIKNYIASFYCACLRCPSYPECKELCDPNLYCIKGKSKEKISKKGCVCSECIIAKIKKFKGSYYCIKGKQK